jgi:hypothetical protein
MQEGKTVPHTVYIVVVMAARAGTETGVRTHTKKHMTSQHNAKHSLLYLVGECVHSLEIMGS